MKNAIVLAAGKGTRMHSDVPKVLHKVCGMPMAEVIVKVLKQAGTDRIVAVTGFGHALVEEALAGQCEFALQEPQLGTGHAVMQAATTRLGLSARAYTRILRLSRTIADLEGTASISPAHLAEAVSLRVLDRAGL